MPGITIGDNTVVGAGSVVTSDLPANVVAFGVPCKVVREIGERIRSFMRKEGSLMFGNESADKKGYVL